MIEATLLYHGLNQGRAQRYMLSTQRKISGKFMNYSSNKRHTHIIKDFTPEEETRLSVGILGRDHECNSTELYLHSF